MQVDLVNPQATILREIADKSLTRDDVALSYAFCIRQQDECDFPAVNAAIIERWSLAGLKYIKTKAWAYVGGQR